MTAPQRSTASWFDNRRNVLAMLGVVVLLGVLAGGIAARVLHHPVHATSHPTSSHQAWIAVAEVAIAVGMLAMGVVTFRAHRAAGLVGTPEQRIACAHIGQRRRGELLKQARTGQVDAHDPALQMVVARREYLRTRSGRVMLPLMLGMEILRLAHPGDRVDQFVSGVVAVIMGAGSVYIWHYTAVLRRFLRHSPVRSVTPDHR